MRMRLMPYPAVYEAADCTAPGTCGASLFRELASPWKPPKKGWRMDTARATREEMEQHAELGSIARPAQFSAAELELMRAAVERAHQRLVEAGDSAGAPPVDRIDNQRYQMLRSGAVKWEWNSELRPVRSVEPCMHLDPGLEALVNDPRLWGPCWDVIGCEGLSLFSDNLNVKRRGGAPFPWHQDGAYWIYGAEQHDKLVTVLLYLDDANKENGCLWVIPGSHRFGTLAGLKNRGALRSPRERALRAGRAQGRVSLRQPCVLGTCVATENPMRYGGRP